MLSLVRSCLLRMIALLVALLPLSILVAHVYTASAYKSDSVLTIGFSLSQSVQSPR